MWLKQSTSVTVKIGPFVDDSDGKTAETGLAITQADVRLSKNGGNMAQKNDANAATHDEIGWYDCQLDATDTGTLGRLVLMVNESGALPVWHEYMVLPANIYDSLVSGSDYIQADAMQIEGADATDTLDARIDARLQNINLDHLLSAACPGNVITGAVVDHSVIACLAAIGNDISDYSAATDSLEALGGTSAASIADAVWDEQLSGHTAAGSAGEAQSGSRVADYVWDEVIEAAANVNAQTARQLLRIIVSALAGADAGDGDWSCLSIDGNKTRIGGTLSATGARESVTTLDGS